MITFFGVAKKGTHINHHLFYVYITGKILSQIFNSFFYYNSFYHECSIWILFLSQIWGHSLWTTGHVILHTRQLFFGTLSLSSHTEHSYYPLRNHFEPLAIISFVVTKWRIISQVLNLNVMELDRIFYNLVWFETKFGASFWN